MTAAATDQQWAERAAIYRANPNPTTALAAHYHVPYSTAALWARRLKARGLVPSRGRGRWLPVVTTTATCECGWTHTGDEVELVKTAIAEHRRSEHR